MQSVENYKALSHRLTIYGFQPVDLVIILIGWFFIHGLVSSFLLDIVFLIFSAIFSRRLKDRPVGYFISLLVFIVIPKRLVLEQYKDVPSYKAVLD